MVTHKTVGLFMFVGVALVSIGLSLAWGAWAGVTCAGAFLLALAATGVAYLRENK